MAFFFIFIFIFFVWVVVSATSMCQVQSSSSKPQVGPRSRRHVCLIKLIFTYVPYLYTHTTASQPASQLASFFFVCCVGQKWTNSQIDRPGMARQFARSGDSLEEIPASASTHHNSSVMIS